MDFYEYFGVDQGIHAQINDLKVTLLSEFIVSKAKVETTSLVQGENKYIKGV